MDCLFCKIVAGDVPAQLVYEDATTVAFLDNRPLFAGHTLVVPRTHYETLPDLPPERVTPLFLAARRLARAMEDGLGAAGSFVALNNRISQSVPHLHVHVIPRNRGDGLRLWLGPRRKYGSESDAAAHAERIKRAYADWAHQ